MSNNLFAMLCCAALFSCSSKPAALSSAPANPAEVVASVNDLNITAGELTEAAKNRLQRVEQDIYEIKKDTLDGLVETKLIEQAAKKQGKSVDDYLKESIDDKATPPSDDEIKSFYEARKDQIGNKTLKEVSDQIKT
ncbi:MAG: SurA N-terminal domain-containing protein, partial [Deltaproteobacteria bacterium]|nr:SurA N-terminal domain-containing protein [Deltaproteobacteria bacterium]